jgi:hypothetical protein
VQWCSATATARAAAPSWGEGRREAEDRRMALGCSATHARAETLGRPAELCFLVFLFVAAFAVPPNCEKLTSTRATSHPIRIIQCIKILEPKLEKVTRQSGKSKWGGLERALRASGWQSARAPDHPASPPR